jgi:hypothetical protein
VNEHSANAEDSILLRREPAAKATAPSDLHAAKHFGERTSTDCGISIDSSGEKENAEFGIRVIRDRSSKETALRKPHWVKQKSPRASQLRGIVIWLMNEKEKTRP